MEFKNLILEEQIIENHGAIAILSIHRPEALNALNSELLSELTLAIDKIEMAKKFRALIIKGSGEKAFVAGADIKEIAALSPEQAEAFAAKGQRVFRRLEILDMPVIAAVNGFALGGGLELAMSCDFIVASDTARFGLPEVSLGLIPGFGGCARLARYVGLNKAREMIFSGAHLKAADALSAGLVNYVVSTADLMPHCIKLAQSMASKGPVAIAMAKGVMNQAWDMSIDDAMVFERKMFSQLFNSQDVKIGTSAFLNKQTPIFKGE